MAAVADPRQAQRPQCRQQIGPLVADHVAQAGSRAQAHITLDGICYCRTRPGLLDFHAQYADIFYSQGALLGGSIGFDAQQQQQLLLADLNASVQYPNIFALQAVRQPKRVQPAALHPVAGRLPARGGIVPAHQLGVKACRGCSTAQ